MREIKFRAWVGYMKEPLDLEDISCNIDDIGDAIQNSEKLVWMQYTGLKDKNGVEIYEGDILGGIFINPVIWCNLCASFQVAIIGGCAACSGDIHWCDVLENEKEVIGNIWQNPELLKEQ